METKIENDCERAMKWLVCDWQWPAASLFAAGMLLLLAPIWYSVAGAALALIYLQLPVYMLHQWEEHSGDRFRQYVNQKLAGGREVLTPSATFWINLLGVWAVDLVALYLACFVALSLGLIAIYLPLVNAVVHVGQAAARREYNPGLCTSLALFLPIGGWSLYEVASISRATWGDQAIAAIVAVAVHLAIVGYLTWRMGRAPKSVGVH